MVDCRSVNLNFCTDILLYNAPDLIMKEEKF